MPISAEGAARDACTGRKTFFCKIFKKEKIRLAFHAKVCYFI